VNEAKGKILPHSILFLPADPRTYSDNNPLLKGLGQSQSAGCTMFVDRIYVVTGVKLGGTNVPFMVYIMNMEILNLGSPC
jgi:hypothetical protein